jgi:HrpA-like RNA helicase
MGVQVGSVVGYQIGMERVGSHETALMYMTTGILKQQLINQRGFSGWTHIILDEGTSHACHRRLPSCVAGRALMALRVCVMAAHERDLDSDFVLLIQKNLLVRYPHVRLIGTPHLLADALARTQSS